jgi:hypothetical protein
MSNERERPHDEQCSCLPIAAQAPTLEEALLLSRPEAPLGAAIDPSGHSDLSFAASVLPERPFEPMRFTES